MNVTAVGIAAAVAASAAVAGEAGRTVSGALPAERSALICRVSTTTRVAFLTFDDGPGQYTPAILDLLREHGIRAVFFVLGDVARYRTGVLRRIADEGHEVGNHTWTHRQWYAAEKKMESSQLLSLMEQELADTERLIGETVGIPPRFVRMPGGFYRTWMNPMLRRRDYRIINWTAGYDWHRMSEDEMVERYCRALAPGGIYLFHDGGANRSLTVAVARRFVRYAVEHGYSFGVLGEWIGSAEKSP